MVRASERLRVRSLTYIYPGARRAALRDVSFEVLPGRTLAVVGPSGAGKSTLLRAISGLEPISEGEVRLGARDLRPLAPQDRRIALVFQRDALFDHMSVRANLRFALRADAPAGRIETLATLFDVRHHLDRMPAVLSGGERGRVSIVRALLSDPDVLLLDEPFAHLDPELRARVRNELVGVREHFAGPIVYVTHDHAEAMATADELLILVDGAVEDSGDPQRVYDAPRTVRVASFLGDRPMNLLGGVRGAAIAGIRPEHVRIDGGGELAGVVLRRERTGADAYVYARTPAGTVVARVAPELNVRTGDEVRLSFDEQHLRLFDAVSGATLA